jgi:branched-chain amino acid transport system permease protein
MDLSLLVQYFFSGVTSGSVYAIVAIGFNIIYNTTGIINFAQGEFVMLGGMTAISLAPFMPLPLAIGVAVILTALVGGAIEILCIRWLRDPTVLQMIVITIGLSILLREAALHIWDEKVRSLPYFTGNEVSSLRIAGAYISPQVLWVLGVCAGVVVLLHLFFTCTLAGKAMRACAASKVAASLCGVNTGNMVTLSFMVSAAIGALAGCVVSPIAQTHYDCGAPLAVKGFTVAILGGLGNSTGAVAAGLVLGVIEAASVSLLPTAYKDVVSIAILLAVLTVKPSGLFAARAAALKEF